jgi:hypothetical protein
MNVTMSQKQRKTPQAIPGFAGLLRLPGVGQHSGRFDRHGGCATRCGTDLAEQN